VLRKWKEFIYEGSVVLGERRNADIFAHNARVFSYSHQALGRQFSKDRKQRLLQMFFARVAFSQRGER
jgi:hypothetical protein